MICFFVKNNDLLELHTALFYEQIVSSHFLCTRIFNR